MALIHRGVRAHAIEVAFTRDVIQPYAFSTIDDDVQRMIVVGAVSLFERYEPLSRYPERRA